MKDKFKKITDFIYSAYGNKREIPLHEPKFTGNEKKYINDCVDSTYVSSVGEYVERFEQITASYTGAKYAVATVNGTAALHIALLLVGVRQDDEVITQPLAFVATANAIQYCRAYPVFIDIDRDTLGLSAEKLEEFLSTETQVKDNGFTYNKTTGKRISACVPMHTLGHPAKIDTIKEICCDRNIALVEDAAEAMGSLYKKKHTGRYGIIGVLSFNGNKIITTGGGGMIITDDKDLAEKAKHITTQAKVPHKWEFVHDMTGYNYRMPNINAALGCAQMEMLDSFIMSKRKLADKYKIYFDREGISFFTEPEGSRSNYWLNAIVMNDREERDGLLEYSNQKSIMTRPLWTPIYGLDMYKDCYRGNTENTEWLFDRIVNIPSSVTYS
ncbi:LegC family aminotransferase [Spirochaetota bacterium]